MLKIEDLWQAYGFTPNPEQDRAIRTIDGPLYLSAGPGSGKTRVLLWRTLNLIVFHGIKPDDIFLSTFTEKAALQLKEGLRSLLGLATNRTGTPYDVTPMYIGTVHSLCQRILNERRRFNIERKRNLPPKLLDELGQYFHLARNRNWRQLTDLVGGENPNEEINKLFSYPSASKHVAMTNLQGLFNRFSEELVDPDLALAQLNDPNSGFDAFFKLHSIQIDQVRLALDLYKAYLSTLAKGAALPLTDFALLQQEAYKVLINTNSSETAFKHVIVDEYQDTNTIQELIFFKLATGSKNICVVGDDDQALYRFRGATVENFVEFPARCKRLLGLDPLRINLATNYRSQNQIVNFYRRFIELENWSKGEGHGGQYRVSEKQVLPFRTAIEPAVATTTPGIPGDIYPEIAKLCKELLSKGKVQDPNQIAFLFPSLKSITVERMREALKTVGLRVYAPRAGRFLEVDEAYDIFGLFVSVFGRPTRGDFRGQDYANFMEWIDQIEDCGKELVRKDVNLKNYVQDRQAELARIASDYSALLSVVASKEWSLTAEYNLETMKRPLYNAPGLSTEGKKLIGSSYLDQLVKERADQGRPFLLAYIIKRVTSLDWNVLDLFYRFCGFDHFKQMFDLGEKGEDAGPMANLGLITKYLGRFVDEQRVPVITADLLLEDKLFLRIFFMSFLYSLYRLGESEFEDAEDPFPKGRIPFLTIHQAKGLEFPVVVLPNPRKDIRPPSRVEILTRPFLQRDEGEPLNRMAAFDTMRMFYVALSRARNLLVVAHLRGRGQSMNQPFKTLLGENNDIETISELDLDKIPTFEGKEEDLPRTYSFTSDFLAFRKCPRQYMVFKKYGFIPSRSQTMFFGSLVHRTLEDLHHELIRVREASKPHD